MSSVPRTDRLRLLGGLVRTSASRAGLLHAGLTLLATLAILGTVYVTTAVYERRATEDAISAEVRAMAVAGADGGLPELARQLELRAAADTTGRALYALLDRNGRTIAGNLVRLEPVVGWHSIAITGGNHQGDRALGFGVVVPGGAFLFIGRHLGQLEELEGLMVRAIVIAGGVAVLLSILGGVLLGRSVQRRAVEINQALAAVAEGDLGRRLPTRRGGDEFDALAAAVNATLARLEAALAGLHQVTGDIAHDLRTPLSRMRQRLERVAREARDDTVPRDVVDRAIADIDEVLGIFAALLRIAQIESGERRASFSDVDLSAALSDVVEALTPTAEDAGRVLEVAIDPGLRLRGDRELLQQACVNLIENAFRHTPAGTPVRIALARDGAAIVVSITDRGAGIPEADRERVLRPFVRLDESRSTPGTGLGLALVRAVAELHGARLILADARPGLRVTLRFRGQAGAASA